MISAKHVAISLMVAVAIVPSCASGSDRKISDPDQGYVSLAKDVQYWPDESHARYSVYYPTVNMDRVAPGAGNEFRLVVHNLTSIPLDFNVSVDSSDIEKPYRPVPADWVTITEGSDDGKPVSSVVAPAENVLEGKLGTSTSWVHVHIPNDGKWKNQKMQFRVKVEEVVDEGTIFGPLLRISPGPSILVTVSTSDHKAGSGEKNAPVILGILVAGILAVGGAVYGFSRWRWPDRPKKETDAED